MIYSRDEFRSRTIYVNGQAGVTVERAPVESWEAHALSPAECDMLIDRAIATLNACDGIADPAAMVAAFLDLSSYVGGHDERPGHPCRVASDILAPLRSRL